MPETKPAWENLEKLQAFPTFQDQDAAAATLAPGARGYIPTDDEKNWYDPNPAKKEYGKVHFTVGTEPWVMYPYVFNKRLDANQDGLLDNVAMPVDVAGKVNIKPSGLGQTNVPGTGHTVPVPFSRDLLPTEKIRRQTPMGDFDIRNIDVQLASEIAAETVDSISDEVVAIGTMVTALAQAMELVNERLAKIMAKLGIS